jgi:RNA polymerase sigma-70 factor (ECF subfamily)
MGSLAELWKQCVRNPDDNAKWEQLVHQQRPLFVRIVVRVFNRFGVQDPGDREDAVQEVCIKLNQQAKAESFPTMEDSALEAYLRASIANSAHDFCRAKRARRRDVHVAKPLDESLADLVGDTTQDTDRALLLRQLEALAEGSPRDLSVFSLYYRQGLSAREISLLPSIGLNPKGVESLIKRMAEGIRKKLKGETPVEGISLQDT